MAVKQNTVFFLYRTLWEFAKGFRGDVIIYTTLFVFANVCLLVEPLIIAHMLNVVQMHGLTQETVGPILWSIGGIFLMDNLFWAFHGPARVLERRTAYRVFVAFKSYLLRGVMHLPAQWHVDHHSGDTIDKIEKSSRALYDFTENTFEIIQIIVRMSVAYVALIIFFPPAGAIVLVLFGLVFFIVARFDRTLAGQYAELYRQENAVSAKVYDIISNITTVIILRIEKLVHSSIVEHMRKPFRLYMSSTRMNEVKWFSTSFFATMLVCALLGTYVYTQYSTGAVIMVGSLSLLYGYANRINDEFFRVTYMYSDLVRRKTSIQNVAEVRAEFSADYDEEKESLPTTWKEIDVRNLSFSYHSEEGADVHLDDVSLTIRRGEKIAFVGHSGSGKTTLLKIIRGLYAPQYVEVIVDGIRQENGFVSFNESIALVPQDPEIFSTTIEENITVGVEYPQEIVEQYATLAQFHDVALRLPKGYQSSVVEKGVNLSGGEKQRLALTRGLLASREKQLLLLDEPTSSVDPYNERQIYTNIFKEFKELTVLSSIHRLHLLPLFDRVIFFEEGKILAVGQYSELLKTCPQFAAVWNAYTERV